MGEGRGTAMPLNILCLTCNCRNPDPDLRPTFRGIVLKLVGDLKQILEIPLKDLNSHPKARRLGEELEAGLLMYRDLQHRYRQ